MRFAQGNAKCLIEPAAHANTRESPPHSSAIRNRRITLCPRFANSNDARPGVRFAKFRNLSADRKRAFGFR